MYVHIEESQRDDFLNWIDEYAEIEWNGVTVSWVYRIVVDSAQRSNLLEDLKTKNFTKYATIYEDTVKRILDTEPNDPYYIEPTWGDGYYVWPHKNHSDPANAGSGGDFDMDSEKGWDISTDGSGVIVLVHDQGFRDTHEDFQGNLWNNLAEINGVQGVDDDNNGYVDDLHGHHVNKHGDHGTGVGGAVAARGNNGLGSVGSAWTAQLSHYSEAVWCQGGWNCIGGTPEAIDYANLIGAKIFNASYGYYCNGDGDNDPDWGCIQSEEAVIDAFNGLFVAAAGNDSIDNDVYWNMPSSARNDHVVAVGALHQDGTNEFNYGLTSVDVHGFASLSIGCGILPYCSADDSEGGTDDCYAIFGGTSCATPQTAGLLALRWTQCPNDTRLEIKQSLIDAAEELVSLSSMSVSEGMNNMFNLLNSPCFSNLTPPETTITSNPANPSGPDFTFEFESDQETATFECRLSTDIDPGVWETCTSPESYHAETSISNLEFEVRAVLGSVLDETPASYIWDVDADVPESIITLAPSNPSNSTSATFEFSSDDNSATFECNLDSGTWEACISPKDYPDLSEGPHIFEVKAIDLAGNEDETPASWNWDIDVTVPETLITSNPVNPTSSTSAIFEFESNEPDSTFECKLDDAGWESCSSPKTYTGLTENVFHLFEVKSIDLAGNEDETPASWNWEIDTIPDTVTILSGPADPTNSTSATFEFTSGNPSASFECALNFDPWTPCTSPYTYSSLSEGFYTMSVLTIDEAGNIGSDLWDPSGSGGWFIDLTPPTATITSGPADPTNSTSATFEFESNEPDSTFECLLDWPTNQSWESCTSPWTYEDLTEGEHEFELRAVDSAGNFDGPNPTQFIWNIDLTSPETTIDSGPGLFDGSETAVFTFSSNEPNSTFQCSLDNGLWQACTSPKTLTSLSESSHVFKVKATDISGNEDVTADEWDWTVDMTDPEAIFISGPSDPSSLADAVFEFESNEANSTFECQLVDVGGTESVGWHSCTSPAVFSDLESGPWYFEFKAIDQAGNEDASEEWHWTIDLDHPQTTIDSGPPSLTNETFAIFEFSSDDPTAAFKCSLNQNNWIPCVSGGMFSPLDEGSHNFQVKAIDEAGNEDVTADEWIWVIDTTEPNTAIISQPSNPSNDTSGEFQFIELNSEEVLGFECRVDSGEWYSCETPHSTAILEDGTHSFEVRAIDLAGNVDSSASAYAWVIDTEEPETDITNGPSSPTTETIATFTFSSNEANSTFQCNLDSGEWEICTSPKDYPSLSEGSHVFYVVATDPAGNQDLTPSEWNWTIDTQAPETSIDSDPINISNSTSATFEFSSDDSNSTFQCSLDASEWEDCSSPETYPSLLEGSHSFLVRSVDVLGNTDETPASEDWIIDLTEPETLINNGPPSITSETTAVFNFSSNEANSTFQCSLDASEWGDCSSPETYTGLTFGNHSFSVKAIDEAGNEDSSASGWNWLINAEADVEINSGPEDGEEIYTNTATFLFSSTNQDATFECKINAGNWNSCTSPHETSPLQDGSNMFNVRAIINGDSSGTDSRSFIVDAVDDIFTSHQNPIEETTIDLPPGGIDNQAIFRFGYEKTDGPPGDDNYLSQITLKASGTGNDQIDISKVEIWLDMDENGEPDNPQNNLGESVFVTDNGSLTINLVNHTSDVSFDSKVFYLVTYDFSGEDSSASNPFDIETLLAFMFMGVVFSRRKRIAGMLMILFFVTSCGGGGGGGNQKTNHTYSVSIENHLDVSSNEDSLIQLESSPITSNEITIRK